MKLFFILMGFLISVSSFATQIEVSVAEGIVKAQERHSYNFGIVWPNTRREVGFSIKNTGSTPLTFNKAIIYGGDFSARHSCANGLLPNEVCNFSIAYWPMFEGISSGQFRLGFHEDEVIVDLWGQANRM